MTAILRISLVVICLLISMPVFAADYYVRDCDGDSSCGTAAGTSWTNPFDTLAAAVTAVQTAGRSATGDTIWVADGSYIRATLNVPTNGNAVITIKKATVAAHGTETGWQNSYGDGQAIFTNVHLDITTAYWTIDGATRTSETSGYGFVIQGNIPGDIIDIAAGGDTLIFRYLEITSPNVPLTNDCQQQNTCPRAGFYSRAGANDILVEYCYIHDIHLPLFILGNTNFTYRYNIAARNDSMPGSTGPHSEFVSISYGVSNNLVFHSNKIIDIEGTAIWAIMNSADVDGLYAWNNLIYYTGTADADHLSDGIFRCTNTGTTCNNFYVYNNTMVNLPGSGQGMSLSSVPSASNWIIKNNLWHCSVGASCAPVNNNATGMTYDDNWYSGVTYNASENGAINGGSEDPFTNAATYDFTLKEGAGPVGVGSDLALVTPFSVYGTADYAGNVRSAPWDIGAYKYGEAAPDTTSPTISTATINAAGDTLTLVFSEPVAVNTSTGFTVAMNYGPAGLAYTSGSGTATIVYSITGRLIEDNETGSLDYVTVTNGIEDAAGNDLASTGESDITVTNNSTHIPSEPSYTVTISVGAGCTTDKATAEVVEAGTVTVTCTPSNNYTCIAWTATAGCSGGSGTTTYTSGQVTGSCTVTQPCRKISPDATLGSGAAVTLGSGAVCTLY